MTNISNLQGIIGHHAIDSNGDKIGKIGGIYLDDQTEEPRWVTISTGLFGTKESFAPLHGATQDGDDLRLAVTKDQVKDAPSVEADGHLEQTENDALYTHYQGFLTSNATGDVGTGEGHDTSGPNTDTAMTRSEERLQVGTQNVETGRARLRKYVVTENVTHTVPVSHEEVRVVREPITDTNRDASLDGPAISEEEHEVTLHAEQPVIAKETVPVERVTLGTETVTDEQTITEQVRKEQIDETGAETAR